MTRENQLSFCNFCVNRKFEANRGLFCGITGKVPIFETICKNFKRDDTISQNELSEGIRTKLSDISYLKLLLNQNLPMAIISGLISSIIGALLWAMVSLAFNFYIGYLAIVIGVLVGFSVRQFGKGVENLFGVIGACFAILGCMLGNIFGILGIISSENGYLELLMSAPYNLFMDKLIGWFNIMDFVFYGIAAYISFKLAIKKN